MIRILLAAAFAVTGHAGASVLVAMLTFAAGITWHLVRLALLLAHPAVLLPILIAMALAAAGIFWLVLRELGYRPRVVVAR